MAENNRPPNILPQYRSGVRFSAWRQNEIVEAVNRENTGISQPFLVPQDVQGEVALENISITIDGAGSAITTSVPSLGGATIPAVPVACNIIGWTVEADQAGAIAVDVLRCTAAAAAANPTNVTGQLASIVGSGNKPTLAATNQYATAAPSGWTSTQLAVGDVVGFSVSSATTVQRVTVALKVQY